MGLDSIWREDGNYLTKRSEKLKARSIGCDCCSTTLETEAEVKREVIDSLTEILLARRYFRWNFIELIEEAKKSKKLKKFKDKG